MWPHSTSGTLFSLCNLSHRQTLGEAEHWVFHLLNLPCLFPQEMPFGSSLPNNFSHHRPVLRLFHSLTWSFLTNTCQNSHHHFCFLWPQGPPFLRYCLPDTLVRFEPSGGRGQPCNLHQTLQQRYKKSDTQSSNQQGAQEMNTWVYPAEHNKRDSTPRAGGNLLTQQ